MEEDGILQPIKAYKSEYEQKHRQLTEEYFDRLVQEAGVSPEENAELMKRLADESAKLDSADKKVRNGKSLRSFVIFCIVALAVVAAIIALLYYDNEKGLLFLSILVPALAVAAIVGLIVVICKIINKKIRANRETADVQRGKVGDVEQQARLQMSALNDKYDWNISDKLVYDAVPHIQIDKYFDEDKLQFFRDNYNMSAGDRDDVSVFSVKSGNSDGNPFLLVRFLFQNFVDHVYRGSRVVTWTEIERDSNGHTHTVTHSETLVATVVKPKPDYYLDTFLFYGNDAAPDLTFTRKPVVPDGATGKKIDSIVRSGEKRLEKKSREAVNSGGSYGMMANSEFEVLFGAEDRNDEVQFRMMFTPLAQRNMVELLRGGGEYGDDFSFTKCHKVNVIHSDHGLSMDIDANPSRFVDYDLARARKNFIDYNVEYFRSVYFDFAPLLCVPLYTQTNLNYGLCEQRSNIGEWEAECVANHFDPGLFKPMDAATDVVLKARVTECTDKATAVQVDAYSFSAHPRVEVVPVHCRNGDWYDVPVEWIEYLPTEQSSTVQMEAVPTTREEYIRSGDAADKASVLVNGILARYID